MRILELRFKNLNSLYGDWIIDFRDQNYVSNGIFSLTGPTGAGKSTILDAICLALYGKTPRLTKINKSENEIMSRQTGDCYAEVLFETQEGQFRCHWEQRRARRKAKGKLQDVEHQIIDAKTGKPLESKKSLVSRVIEEKTGMDFERFTRSVLLAQGGFDSFLKAGDDEKSKILEQLTGSKIYTEISKSAYQKQKEEKDKLAILKAGIAGITLLEKDWEKEIRLDLADKQKTEEQVNLNLKELNKALDWLNTIAELKDNIAVLESDDEKLQASLTEFKPQRRKLILAQKATKIEVSYTILNSLRKQKQENLLKLSNLEATLPQLKSTGDKQIILLEKAEAETKKTKKELERTNNLLKQVRSLDQSIADKQKQISDKENAISAGLRKIEEAKSKLSNTEEKIQENIKDLENIQTYITDNQADEWLISNLTGLEEQFKRLDSLKQGSDNLQDKIKKKISEIKKAEKKIKDIHLEEIKLNDEIDEIKKTIQGEQTELDKLLGGRLLRELRTNKDHLLNEKGFIQKIISLEEEREHLKNGEPCPLCGSQEHPFAVNNTPQLDDIDRNIASLQAQITQAEKKIEQIEKYGKDEVKLKENLNEFAKNKASAQHDLKTLEQLLNDFKDNQVNTDKEHAKLQASLTQSLQPWKSNLSLHLNTTDLLKSLKSRLTKWSLEQKNKIQFEKELAHSQNKIKILESEISSHKKNLQSQQAELQEIQNHYLEDKGKRKLLYGNKNPDIEEKNQQKSVRQAENKEKQERDKSIKLQQEIATKESDYKALKKQIEQVKKELITSENDFQALLKERDFEDEKQFQDSLLPHDQIDLLATEAQNLDKAQTEIQARLRDKTKDLQEKQALEITNKAKEKLEEEAKEFTESQVKLQSEIAEIKLKLFENAKAMERIKEEKKNIEAQEKECVKWDKLSTLIGSADGKKYRNFAQGLTFELMVIQANSHLARMTERYLLLRDKENPLELQVIDNYQAGEIRSTKNLSGGESFIVSLALALGLSSLASKKVRVDSLFLDEGFGTLDEEALETALEALSSLHQDGKLIGVISHVSSLKDRISTQISISPLSGGKSTIEGPGCYQKADYPKSAEC